MGLLDKVAGDEKAVIATGIFPAKLKRVEIISSTQSKSKGIKPILEIEGADVYCGYVNTVKKDGTPNDIGTRFMEKLAVVTGLDELPTEEELITIGNESKPCIVGWGEAPFEVAIQEVDDGQYTNLNIYELFFADKSSVAEKVNGDTSHKRYDLIKTKLKPKTVASSGSSGAGKNAPKEDEEEEVL